MNERRVLDENAIQERIPHRSPFLFLTQVEILEEGKKARGELVDFSKPEYSYLIPTSSEISSTILLEGCAQLGATIFENNDSSKIGVLAGLDDVKVYRPVHIGDSVHVETEVIAKRGVYGKLQGVVSVENEVALEGKISFVIITKPDSSLVQNSH